MTNYDHMTLRQYTEEIFLGIIKKDCPDNYFYKTRRTVNLFEDWCEEEPLIGDINSELLELWEKEGTGLKKKTTYPEWLWVIMRTASPGKYPKVRGEPKPREDLSDGPMFILTAFYAQLYEPNAMRTRRENTKRLYRYTLRWLDKFLDRPATLDDLTDDTLNRFANWRREQGRQENTVNRNLTDLIAMWRWAHKKNYVQELPDIEIGKEVKKTPIAWKQKELDRIFESARQEEGRIGGVPAAVWWNTLLLMFWDTGERKGAVMALKWDSVDTEDGWVRFPADTRKGGREDNSRRLAKDTRASLESLRRWQETAEVYSPTGEVFLWDFSETYLYRLYGKILKRAGLPDGPAYKFHCLRKTVASHFEKAGGNATELLGHASRDITKCYLDPKIVDRIEAVDLLFRPKAKEVAEENRT